MTRGASVERAADGSVERANARVLAVVPAFNEAESVPGVVRELSALESAPDVMVIDDGSEDATAEAAARAGAMVVSLPFNCGIGASVQVGLGAAIEDGYDLVARFDGDGQHDPAALSDLCAPLFAGEADFVLGSRYRERTGYQSTRLRRLGSRWFALLLRVTCRLDVTDPTSGCWAANRRAVEVLHAEYAFDYPEVDALVHLARAGCRVVERPVTMRARGSGRSSIDALRALYYMIKVTIALVVGRMRPRAAIAAKDEAWSSKEAKGSASSVR